MKEINRLILNFPGFEATNAVHQIERLTSGGEKTGNLWGFELSRGKISEKSALHKTTAEFAAKADKWRCRARFVQFSWHDIIEVYENTPYPYNLALNFPKYFAFFLDGSVRRYAKASRRYWGFTIYPILLMLLFASASWLASYWLLSGFEQHWIFTAVPAALLFLVLCKFPGDLAYVNLSINDWGFARDMCNRSNPDIEKRYDDFASHMINEIENRQYDEILIVGHSFGSVWAVASLAKALERKPKLLKNRNVTFLALGSSLLKIALVRKAAFYKKFIEKVLGTENLVWHEIQTKTDFISFYKSDPFEPLKIMPKSQVWVHRVNFKSSLSDARHKKMMKSMYLAHRQYILYADRRVHFDFQLRCFGPFFASELAAKPELIDNNPLIADFEDTRTR